MKILAALLLSLAMTVAGIAAEPIAGTWRMTKQEMTGRPDNAAPLILTIKETLAGLEFAYSVLTDDKPVVQIQFTTHADGTPADVKGRDGSTVGSATVKKNSPREYNVTMRPGNRPESTGTMKVSSDGKTLTSESDTDMGKGKIHAVQIFTRL